MTRATDHQIDRNVVTIELDGSADERGRHHFSIVGDFQRPDYVLLRKLKHMIAR